MSKPAPPAPLSGIQAVVPVAILMMIFWLLMTIINEAMKAPH